MNKLVAASPLVLGPVVGDVVTGNYYGVPFVGVLVEKVPCGTWVVDFPAGYTKPVVLGFERDGIAIHALDRVRFEVRKVAAAA